MHTYIEQDYTNLLPLIKLTATEILNTIAKFRLTFSQERNREVEWGIRLPMFVDAFYAYILEKGTIPSQEESYNFYIQYNNDFFLNLNRPDLMSGIKARVYRTYPSLVRDVYFNKYIEERLKSKCSVIYSTKLDIVEGIDLMIRVDDKNYGFCFFTETRRGYVGRAKKVYRHTPFDNVEYIEMPMEFKGSVKAGDFFLYGDKEYNQLYNYLKF
jgi:hypothetical protein